MPFKSQAQARFMFAKHPGMAQEFADKTPSIKALPDHVAGGQSMVGERVGGRGLGAHIGSGLGIHVGASGMERMSQPRVAGTKLLGGLNVGMHPNQMALLKNFGGM